MLYKRAAMGSRFAFWLGWTANGESARSSCQTDGCVNEDKLDRDK